MARIRSDAARICDNIFAFPQTLRRGDRAQSGDRELATEDDDDHPRRGQLELNERNESRGDQKLVGDRVEEGAERRDLAAPPRQPAVEKVRRRREEKDQEPDGLAPFELRQENDEEERDQEDAQERQRVREVDVQLLFRLEDFHALSFGEGRNPRSD